MAKFTVTVPFPYSRRIGGAGTQPRTITVEADNPNAAAVKLVGFGIPYAAASSFDGIRDGTVKADVPLTISQQGGGAAIPTPLQNLPEMDTPSLVTRATGANQLGSIPTGSSAAEINAANAAFRQGSGEQSSGSLWGGAGDLAGTNLTPTDAQRNALQAQVEAARQARLQAITDTQPDLISNLAARTGTGTSSASFPTLTPPSNLGSTSAAGSSTDSQEANQFAANERARIAELNRQIVNATNSSTSDFVGDPSGSAGVGNVTGTVPTLSSDFGTAANGEIPLPTGVIEPLGTQSRLTIGGGDDADKSNDDPTRVTIPETDAEKAPRLVAEAKAAIDAGISADANLTLAPDTLEFQRAQFLQGLRNRGLGNSGVAGQARRDAFGQANTRNIFNNVFNRGEDDQVGLSDFVGNANNALMGAGARAQAQNQFQQALDLSRGFNPAGTGFDTQGLTTLQQDILNPQGAGQAGLLNDLAMQTARKKFGVGAEFLGRRNFADEFFGQDRGTAGTFAEHLNKRLFGGRF